MKSTKTGAISGCIVWIIVFGILSMCVLPVASIVGGFTSASGLAMQVMGPFICPDGSSARSYSYATTTTDANGNRQPSTAYVLQCVDAGGDIVKEDHVVYAFAWISILALAGLIVAAILAFVFAAPAGTFIGRLLNKNNKTD